MEKNELQDRTLDERESIELITRMIQNTQGKLERNAAMPMLIWGYATIFTTFIVWLMVSQTGNHNWHYFWFAIPAISLPLVCLRKRKPSGVRTYIDVTVKYIWLVAGSTTFVLSAMSIFHFMRSLPILFIVILMTGMSSVLTGLIIKFKPFVAGGIVAMLLGIVLYSSKTLDMEMSLFALAFIAMDIIPGHILNHRAKKECSKN